MNLTDAQRQTVAQWISEGLKLAEIQSRLAAEFGIKITYMEARFLVDDLKLVPKDPEPPKAPAPAPGQAAAPKVAGEAEIPEVLPAEDDGLPPVSGKVSVTMDQITRPGAMLSGKVTFSDGQDADWYVDQMGRLGIAPKQKGYKPTTADAQEFQIALQREAARLGY